MDEQTYKVNQLVDQVNTASTTPTNPPRVFHSSLSFTQQLTNDRKYLFIGLYEQFYRKALENTAFLKNEGPEFDYLIPLLQERLSTNGFRVLSVYDGLSGELAGFCMIHHPKDFCGESVNRVQFMCFDGPDSQKALYDQVVKHQIGNRFYGYLRFDTLDEFIESSKNLGMIVETNTQNFPDELGSVVNRFHPKNRTNWVCMWYPKT